MMNDFIQKSSEEVSIVIYDSPLPPRYFKLTKKFIKTLFISVPIFLTIMIVSFFYWGLSSRLKDSPAIALPSVLTESENNIYKLEAEIKSLQESNTKLSDKLAASPTTTTGEDPFLLLIKKPYGMQNLLSSNKVTLDQFDLVQTTNSLNLKFQIISSVPETKVTGHVLVFLVSEKGLLAYPSDANRSLSQGVKYSSGEPFSVSRLRPTNAQFSVTLTDNSVKFLIYIFNREGDLLLIQETDSFKLGAK